MPAKLKRTLDDSAVDIAAKAAKVSPVASSVGSGEDPSLTPPRMATMHCEEVGEAACPASD